MIAIGVGRLNGDDCGLLATMARATLFLHREIGLGKKECMAHGPVPVRRDNAKRIQAWDFLQICLVSPFAKWSIVDVVQEAGEGAQ